jgi:hypothetical protein
MKHNIIAIGLILATTTSAMAGIEFTSKITNKGGQTISRAKGWVDGPKARIEYVSGQTSAGLKRGSYILSKDGGKTVYAVDPQNKSYMKFDIDKLASKVGDFMNAASGFINLKFTNPNFKTISDSRGTELYGLSTRHVKTETSYTVTASVFGQKNITSVSRKDEIWLTKKLKDSGMKIWTQQRSIKTGNQDIDKIIASETKRLDGIPLKITSVTTTTENNSKPDVTTVTHEITSLKRTKIASDTFEIPEDYTNNNAEIATGFKALTQQMQDDTKDSDKGSPAAAVNSLMNGLFGGRK